MIRGSVTDKLLNCFAGIAVLVVNYVAYSLILLAFSYRLVNGQILVGTMLEFMIVVMALVLYSLRVGYSSDMKGWTPNKAWRILRVGFQGSMSVLLVIFLVVIASGLKNIYVIGSLCVSASFLAGVWIETTYILRITEPRVDPQGDLHVKTDTGDIPYRNTT